MKYGDSRLELYMEVYLLIKTKNKLAWSENSFSIPEELELFQKKGANKVTPPLLVSSVKSTRDRHAMYLLDVR